VDDYVTSLQNETTIAQNPLSASLAKDSWNDTLPGSRKMTVPPSIVETGPRDEDFVATGKQDFVSPAATN
jgi:hypothetical protein